MEAGPLTCVSTPGPIESQVPRNTLTTPAGGVSLSAMRGQPTESIRGTALSSYLGAGVAVSGLVEDQLRASKPGCNATRPGSPRSFRW